MANKNNEEIRILDDTLIDPIGGSKDTQSMKLAAVGDKAKKHTTDFKNLKRAMHSNLLFSKSEKDWYNSFFRFGWINPHDTDQVSKEFLFFTKPDLYLMDGTSLEDAKLNDSLKDHPFFIDAFRRHKDALGQLQGSIKDSAGRYNPFMALLTNTVTSKMDLPGISAESQDSTNNIYGVNIAYRSHSLKSDGGFDFSLSFTDSAYLEIYTMVKAYDEYMRLLKTGQIDFLTKADDNTTNANTFKNYVIWKIVPEQFSVYKFLIGSDGETILYYAKATGVYFVDVPRSDFGDPPNDGFKYSLSFHANFVEDNNPIILEEFNAVSNAKSNASSFANIYDEYGINNEKVYYPCIRIATASTDKRVAGRGTNIDYRLKWTNIARKTAENYDANGNYTTDTTLVTQVQ